jgi:hypothetical protein
MDLPSLKSFPLVGGTELALRYGHRSSVDLDMFYHEKFDQLQVVQDRESEFADKIVYKQVHTYFGIFWFGQSLFLLFLQAEQTYWNVLQLLVLPS